MDQTQTPAPMSHPPPAPEMDEEQPGRSEAGHRPHRHRRHRRRKYGPLRVRMRFAWWQLGLVIVCILFGIWLVLALQPWQHR